jgi:hypothetical protein
MNLLLFFLALLICILSVFIYFQNENEYYAGNVTVGQISTIDPPTNQSVYNCEFAAPPYVDWCMYG